MSFKTLLISPDGTMNEVVIENSLESLQSAVQGYIEDLRFTDDVRAFINEDGKSRNLAHNSKATILAEAFQIGLWPGDYISGNILFYSDKDATGEVDGECHDCPPDFIEKVKEILK